MYYLLRELHELFELPHLGLGANFPYFFDSFCAIGNRVHHLVGMSVGGVCDVLVTEMRRIHKPLTSCGLDVTNMSALVPRGSG